MAASFSMTSGVVTTVDGLSMAYDHYRAGHARVVLVAPGFYNSKQSVLIQELALELSQDTDVIAFDFRGHGHSSGRFLWTAKEYLDLEAVLTYAGSFYQDIGVIGFSLGAATALISAGRFLKLKTVVAISPPTDFWKIDGHFWGLDFKTDIIYNFFGEGKIGKGIRPGVWWRQKTAPLEAVPSITCPVMYIHGLRDWLIKPWHSRALYAATLTEKELFLVPDGWHAEYLFLYQKREVLSKIRAWFLKIF